MNLRTNTVKKKHLHKSARVIRLEKTRQLQYSKFKSKVAFLSVTLVSSLLMVGGIVFFLVGQVQLNILNERLLKRSKELKSKERGSNHLLKKNEEPINNSGGNGDGDDDDLNLELDDKVEIF